MFGNPYIECKPECSINPECSDDKACVRNKCVDPCPGVCGTYASCRTTSHQPRCTCDPGYEGDPFRYCTRITTGDNHFEVLSKIISIIVFILYFSALIPVEVVDPCNPTPCGSNAVCQNRNRAAACQCIPEYFGDPYVACRPECVVNSDCPSDKACQRNKCIDPCPGTCGINAECRVLNHVPSCTCIVGYIGDPFSACRQPPLSKFAFKS